MLQHHLSAIQPMDLESRAAVELVLTVAEEAVAVEQTEAEEEEVAVPQLLIPMDHTRRA